MAARGSPPTTSTTSDMSPPRIATMDATATSEHSSTALSDPEGETRCIPSLVSMCQRVAALNVERMSSLGEVLRIDLVKPVLQKCSAGTLLRLEQASPYILGETEDLWKSLCFRTYPLAAEQRINHTEPECWRDEYVIIRDLERQRLEELGSRLRTQREEAEQRKKEGQVKFTERLPTPKRRGWIPPSPKTLLQKTIKDTAKMQKGIYGMRMIPPGPPTHRFLPSMNSAKILPPPPPRALPATSGSRVTVTTVSIRRDSISSVKPPPPKPVPIITQPHQTVVTHSQAGPDAKRQRLSLDLCPLGPTQPLPTKERTTPPKPPLSKKDPKACLFMPKHRVVSQLPRS